MSVYIYIYITMLSYQKTCHIWTYMTGLSPTRTPFGNPTCGSGPPATVAASWWTFLSKKRETATKTTDWWEILFLEKRETKKNMWFVALSAIRAHPKICGASGWRDTSLETPYIWLVNTMVSSFHRRFLLQQIEKFPSEPSIHWHRIAGSNSDPKTSILTWECSSIEIYVSLYKHSLAYHIITQFWHIPSYILYI